MRKAILLSVRPEWVKKILSRQKTIEIRKSAPIFKKMIVHGEGFDTLPYTVYIYCSKQGKLSTNIFHNGIEYKARGRDYWQAGKVVGKFTLNVSERIKFDWISFTAGHGRDFIVSCESLKAACFTKKQLIDYAEHKTYLYAWHIDGLQIFDKPMELSYFTAPCTFKSDCCACDRWNGQMCVLKPLNRPPQSWQYVELLK